MPIIAPIPVGHQVFRGDTRAPGEIFQIGFTPRINRGGIDVQPGGQMIGGVSTTKELSVAVYYAALQGGWVYSVHAETGVDMLTTIQKIAKSAIDNAMTQKEIACSAIPANHVIAARRSERSGANYQFTGVIQENPNYSGPASSKVAATALLNLDIDFQHA